MRQDRQTGSFLLESMKGNRTTGVHGRCFLLYPVSTEPHLHGLLHDAGLEAMEDVDSPSVAVLQRGPHHHVIVGILVEILNGGDAGPEPGVLVAVGILQSAIINKPAL